MGAPHNYLEAPIAGRDIHGGFVTLEGQQLTPEQEQRLAGIINGLVETTRMALWFNPETDRGSAGARAFGAPLEVDGTRVRFTPSFEGAVFPSAEARAERSVA